MYFPRLDDVCSLAGRGNLVPIYREILADLETPVSAYLKIARGTGSFLLESVEGGERLARYSFIGTNPSLVVTMHRGQATIQQNGERRTIPFTNPLRVIRDLLAPYRAVATPNLPRFQGGAVGYLSYEVVRYFEELPAPAADPVGVPESVFALADTLVVFDHLQRKIKVVSHVHLDHDPDGADRPDARSALSARGNGTIAAAYDAAVARIDELVAALRRPLVLRPNPRPATPADRPAIVMNMARGDYEAMVRRGIRYIDAGDIIQVVLSQRYTRPTTADPFTVYRALRTINPSPYMYYLDLGHFQIVGASPELLVRVEEGAATTHPIAGTRRRGRTPAEDLALEAELRHDEKERAEHIMLLDLGRNDIGRVSGPGSVRVTQTMGVERYSHVMHLVSHVTGRLRSDLSSYDALQACFPAGTVSGAPKIRAMEIIAELEPDRRGPYAGAVGYFDYAGNLDTAITLRTLVIKDGIASVQAGGGIVADSTPENEYMESVNKARATLNALDLAEDLD
ncbi:MAG: anthranilate synthase component I [Chloroflexi bacterium]|nr:anthranilate synthase component I [Chloroflexota bacterium]